MDRCALVLVQAYQHICSLDAWRSIQYNYTIGRQKEKGHTRRRRLRLGYKGPTFVQSDRAGKAVAAAEVTNGVSARSGIWIVRPCLVSIYNFFIHPIKYLNT